MSFSFAAAGSPTVCKDVVDENASREGSNLPADFAEAVKAQLDTLPDHAEINMSVWGHANWGENQIEGELSLHVSINARANPPAEEPVAD